MWIKRKFEKEESCWVFLAFLTPFKKFENTPCRGIKGVIKIGRNTLKTQSNMQLFMKIVNGFLSLTSEAYLESSQTSTMKLFCENS